MTRKADGISAAGASPAAPLGAGAHEQQPHQNKPTNPPTQTANARSRDGGNPWIRRRVSRYISPQNRLYQAERKRPGESENSSIWYYFLWVLLSQR